MLAVSLVLLPLGCGGTDGSAALSQGTLLISTTSLPTAATTISYSEMLVAAGGADAYVWSISAGSLPNGLSLNPSSGEISGTPTEAEVQSFTVRISSGDGQTAQRAISITVNTLVTLQPGELCSDHADYAIPTFEDENLDAAVGAALSVGTQEDLACGLLSGLMEFSADGRGIQSLLGLQNLTSLTVLDLNFNSITDISPLSVLRRYSPDS